MKEKIQIESFKSIDEIKKSLSRIKDLKKLKQRLELNDILYKLVLLKEHGSLLEDESIAVALNHVFEEFIKNLKSKKFYDDGQGNIVNITADLEIFNVGFIKSENLTSALDWLYYQIGYKNLYEREKNCEYKRMCLGELYAFEVSARRYNVENDLVVDEKQDIELKKYTNLEQLINEINLITDLNKNSHRKLLVRIIAKVCSLFDYKEYLSTDVFRAISLEFSKLNIRTKNSAYREILKNKEVKKTIENSILKEIFDDKNDVCSTLKYIRCLLLPEELDNNLEPLTIVDIVNLNESASDYFMKKINKYRSLKITTGE